MLITANHVAAIAAGNAAKSTDPYAVDGIAPEAQLLLMNVGDINGNDLSDANIYAALEDAISLGADVIKHKHGQNGRVRHNRPERRRLCPGFSRAPT